MRVLVVALLLGTWLPSPLEAFHRFDPTKWNSSGFTRVQEVNGGKTLLGVSRKEGFDGGASTFSTFNDVSFRNATTIRTLEATVTLLDGVVTGSGFTKFPRAALEGFFYWDGTGSGSATDQTGHVEASAGLAINTATGLPETQFFVGKCMDSSCSNFNTFTSSSLGSINFFEPRRLKLDYDGTRFLAQLDTNPPVTFTAPDATRMTPRFPFMALRTRTLVPASPDAAARILALFDDVAVNGAPYDDFSAKTLPRVQFLPGSGTFPSAATVDVVIMVETAGEAVSNVRWTASAGSQVVDLSGVLASAIRGTLASGGVTFRIPGVSLRILRACGEAANLGRPRRAHLGPSVWSFQAHHARVLASLSGKCWHSRR